MKTKQNSYRVLASAILLCTGLTVLQAQTLNEDPVLDKKVKEFLDTHARQWYDMNVPASDGKLLYDIIIKNNYKRALEIGTSTGHSGIWIAWALSKTGGRLITIDIDPERNGQALKNFKAAGLSDYIDAHLADAHELVPKLEGPFDFVFSDADKDWYKNYFLAVDPKLTTGGCYTSHNVSDENGHRGNTNYLTFLRSLPNYETTVNSSGGGVAISYKRFSK
ncbi:MAG: class I SAM-dependent methyltransferase [Bacteroidota bacterium]